ncbi:hypothetical protein [Jannaschia donghaensis]|uniref:Uncharacterized protein n=1 Tax=Jannaschia donghaensis TaxID=420998 RepID=A0A0M6YE80_9RHOB|nr:hypothetical protein [Jannaschia donghaensis]CTQ48652.1 hypothetical protein JDO7802_00656 [Jannaschia donghaensis]
MIRLAVALSAVLAVSACGGGAPSSGTSPSTLRAVSGGATCPSPDPARDGPLVDAIRTGDAAPISAALARDPSDERATAAQAIVSGRGTADPNQAACFAPYLA